MTGLLRVLCSLALLAGAAFAWQSPPEITTTQTAGTKAASPEFHTRVTVVPVTVVVRNRQGGAVGNLTKDDFRLFDNKKPQEITGFSIQRFNAPVVLEKQPAQGKPDATPAPLSTVIADRFTAYLFDDVHLSFEDLAATRDAAAKLLSTTLQPNERVAIYTTSGEVIQEFTNDLAKLQETLKRLQQRVTKDPGCPPMTYYQANLLWNRGDQQSYKAAILMTATCINDAVKDPLNHLKNTPDDPVTETILSVSGVNLSALVRSAILRALREGDRETQQSIGTLKNLVRRISAMPGRRTIVLASPGFLTLPSEMSDLHAMISRAARASVTVSCLDARGLYTPSAYTATGGGRTSDGAGLTLSQRQQQGASAVESMVLAEVSQGTGGLLIENSNDFLSGLRKMVTAPESVYILEFKPRELKPDGRYHTLSVKLKDPRDFTVQARRGYYSPRENEAAEADREEVDNAVFSRDVSKGIPVDLRTEFVKSTPIDAILSVLARIDVKRLRYRKQEGRNHNEVRVVTALFDPGGNYVAAYQTLVTLRLKDETLATEAPPDVMVKSTFNVKPGTYVVRLVARDSEDRVLTAENGSVVIP